MNKTPKGCSNIGGKLAEKIEYCRNKAMELYAHYGYKPFSPAELQLVESVWENISKTRARRFIPVMSPHGEACVLRGDLTLSAVSYLSTHFNSNERPLRLSYADRVYSVPMAPKSNLEENQVGVELIGWESTGADIETAALLLRTLDLMGIEDAVAVFGDVSVLSYILKDIPQEKADELIDALQTSCYTAYGELLRDLDADGDKKKLLEMLPSLKGDISVIDKMTELSGNAEITAPLKALCESLAKLGYGERIRVDFSFIRDLGYYSGPIYNVYSPETGACLGGGGRYDGLLTKIGVEGEACGFALNIKDLASHCKEDYIKQDVMLWGGKCDAAELLAYADSLAKKKISFELSWTEDKEESQRIARLRGYRCWLDYGNKKVTELSTGKERNLESLERNGL